MTFTAAYASPLGPLLFAAEKEALTGCAGGLEKKHGSSGTKELYSTSLFVQREGMQTHPLPLYLCSFSCYAFYVFHVFFGDR